MCNSTKRQSKEPIRSACEQRLDIVTGRWHLLAGGREQRPNEFLAATEQTVPHLSECAFCAGHEDETTPTIIAYAATTKSPHDWQVRVVENLYPILGPRPSEPAPTEGIATDFISRPAMGQHEVIIETPRHLRYVEELSQDEFATVLTAYRDRIATLRSDPRWQCVLVFKNSGRDAGMSREHLHSQLIALPELPLTLRAEVVGAERFFQQQKTCVFCHVIQSELAARERIVAESASLVAFCPYASRTAYETWILPKAHQPCFSTTSPSVLKELSGLLRELLGRIADRGSPAAYNYVLHSTPFDSDREDHYHWHIEIIPRLSRLAGLEWGTGLHVNTVPPEVSARDLRRSRKP